MSPESLVNGVGTPTNGLPDHSEQAREEPQLRRNNPSKPYVVQKFGGTSIGKFPEVIVEDIVSQWLDDHRVAVVCSARSSSSKVDGTTNRLLRAARETEQPNSKKYQETVGTIRDDHITEAQARIKSPELVASLVSEIEAECRDLLAFLDAIQRVGEVSNRTLDTVISKGEKLSCRFMTALLRDRGVDAQYVDLSETKTFPAPEGLNESFYANLVVDLTARVLDCGESVPVITGFFGKVQDGLLSKIGRGYTDLCAALIAVGLGAAALQIWKEVDGIFTANPAKVPTARLLPSITPAEAVELTFYGSEVLHPFTMQQVVHAGIPIRIRNVRNLRNSGTTITPEPLGKESRPVSAAGGESSPKFVRNRSFSCNSNGTLGGDRPKRPTAVTIKPNILVLNVHSNKRTLSHGFFARIFDTLDRWRLSVDLISTSEVHVSMALHSASALVTNGGAGSRTDDGNEGEHESEIVDADLRGAVAELTRYGSVDISDEMAILSLVGRQMRHMVGVAGRMFTVLGENNINIDMISQGASEINISCVIKESDADRAINILHTNLFTFLD